MAFYSKTLSQVKDWSLSFFGLYRPLQFRGYGATRHEFSLLSSLSNAEYDPVVQRRNGIATFERMSNEDAQISAVLNLIKGPLQAMTWTIEAEDEAVKTYLEKVLGLSEDQENESPFEFHQFVKESLTALELGFCLHELTFTLDEEDGRLSPQAHFRPQISIQDFDEEDSVLKGVEQLTQIQPVTESVYIPADRLIYTAFNRIGGNFWGKSLIRPNYRNWFFKDCLLIISMIESKRFGIPIPHAEHRRGISKKARNEMARFLRDIEADVSAQLVTGKENPDNPDWKINSLFGDQRPRDNLPMIRFHNEEIAKNALVLFMDLGTSAAGNRALAETFAEVLYNALEATAMQQRKIYNKELIQPILTANFPPGTRASLSWSNLSLHGIQRYVDAYVKLLEVNALQVGEADQPVLRNWINMPANPQEEVMPTPTNQEPPPDDERNTP